MVKGIALTAKAAPIRSRDDADMTCRESEHFGQVPMQIVHVLGGSPERELAVMAELRQARMLFQREVGAAFVERDVFPDEVGIGKACFHVAEFVNLSPMDIAELTVLVDARQHKVVGKLQFAGALHFGVYLVIGLSNNLEAILFGSVTPSHKCSPWRARPARRLSARQRAPQLRIS